ncbi:F0F1 ATP synthase subunit gamma [Azospirillum sp. ST 5-10]|uniref:F0F1 ATP synthase subunit gamma n=1 Tax=unclassified Azospirillum TaxID=2630922 RepID=UPI003F49C4B6
MPSLKDLKNRIASVKSTQKITSAMKMVAASKLRRAQEQAEAARPFAERMGRMLASLAGNVQGGGNGPKMMTGTGSDQVQLLLVITSDRGLCGAFNGSIVREARRTIQRLQAEGKTVKVMTVGRKGRDQLRRDYASLIVETYEDVGRRRLSFADADGIAKKINEMYEAGEFDVCTVVYNKFKSAISQVVTLQQLVPFAVEAQPGAAAADAAGEAKAIYEFEPDEEQILAELLPRNLSIQVYRALLESAASEQGARMTAMDNATRNAGDMINRLTLTYNRTRQAYITKELIEIISGAEAL